MRSKKFKAFLFDLDGTVAQTMSFYFLAWKQACVDFGFEINESDYYPLEGMKASELAKTLCALCGGDVTDIQEIVQRKKAYFVEMFEGRRADLYLGAEESLKLLKFHDKKTALVTSSVSEQVLASIASKILEKFDKTVFGEMGGRGKPYPDPYLKAAELFDVEPKNCVGIENAPLGIKSVKSAGMYCVGVAHTVSREKLKEADIVLGSLEEFPEFFNYIGI